MKNLDLANAVIKPDKYQVFLLICNATFPFNFAKHSWLVVNKKGSITRWEVFWRSNRSSASWGHLHKNFFPPLQGIEKFFFSDKYFWKDVSLLGVMEGDEDSVAKQMAEFIENSPKNYPHCNRYSFVGPNSNSYVQWVLNNFPQSNLKLPWNAFGKGKRAK